MNTDLQPKRSSSHKTRLTKKDANDRLLTQLREGKHWPFERVDGRLLVKLHKQSTNNLEEALL
jgi:hypothetical protein